MITDNAANFVASFSISIYLSFSVSPSIFVEFIFATEKYLSFNLSISWIPILFSNMTHRLDIVSLLEIMLSYWMKIKQWNDFLDSITLSLPLSQPALRDIVQHPNWWNDFHLLFTFRIRWNLKISSFEINDSTSSRPFIYGKFNDW